MCSLDDKQRLLDLPLCSNKIVSVHFSPRQDHIVSATRSGFIKVYIFIQLYLLIKPCQLCCLSYSNFITTDVLSLLLSDKHHTGVWCPLLPTEVALTSKASGNGYQMPIPIPGVFISKKPRKTLQDYSNLHLCCRK